jgi:catechol 2,3-dioxygenase-like lactoylglutathione lyase family enzyme
MQLDHVALDVANREASAAFCAEYFGLTNRVHDDSTRLIISGAEEVEWQEDGLSRVQVRDPDGYLVEAYSY